MLKRTVALCMLFSLALSPALFHGHAADSETYCIEVDVTNQITTAYRRSDGVIVRQMICSTGLNNWTPLGTFRMEKSRPKTDRVFWYYISKYRSYVKYATRIKGSILFHSLPYTAARMDSLDAEAAQQLGQKASHGCIRLRWQDARWIAQNCPDGTMVRIYNGAARKERLRAKLLDETYTDERGMTYGAYLDSDQERDGVNTMGLGSSGAAVVSLQRDLARLGLLSPDALSGSYDNDTVRAVMRYQSAAGLAVTGTAADGLLRHIRAFTPAIANRRSLSIG